MSFTWGTQSVYADPRIVCRSCRTRLATVVVYLQEPEHLGSSEPWLLPRCDVHRLDCPDGEIVDTVALTPELVEQLTGLELQVTSVSVVRLGWLEAVARIAEVVADSPDTTGPVTALRQVLASRPTKDV